MKNMISQRTMLLIIIFAAFMFTCSSSTAQPPYCNDFGSVDVDQVCGFLSDELREDDSTLPPRSGIDLTLDNDGDDYFVLVGLDATEVGTRTWGGGSDFAWTFDEGSGASNPKLTFENGRITLDGNFYDKSRLYLGADVAFFPTNTVIYLDKHYSDSADTYYGGYLEVTQTSSINHPSQDRYPATLECKYTYDTTEDTIWVSGRDIRTKVIDGRFMIVNSGRINYAAGITGGVDCYPESQYEVYPGADVAVGMRGGIALADPRPGYIYDVWNYGDAVCFGTYVNIDGGHVKRLAGVGVHTMDISDGIVDEVAGVAIEHLIHRPTDAHLPHIYGFRQEGSEENLFNGYMTVDSNIGAYHYEGPPTPPPFEVENFINIGAKSIFELSYNYVTISEKLIGFKYSTPEINKLVNYDLSVANSYGMYLETSKIDGITNSWGIYQEGNDPNYAKGTWEVNTDIDTTFSGEVSSYNATSTVASDADITSYAGFKYTTPDLPSNPNVDKMYGIYLQQICPTVVGSESVETYGIYQAGSEPNYLKGPVTIDQTEKVRAFLSTAPSQQINPNWYKLCLDGETYDNLGSFDSETYPNPTYQFKAKMDGYYQVNATVLFSVTLNPAKIGIAVRKNGTVEYALSYGRVFVNNDMSLSISDIIPLNKDETIQLWVWIAGPNVQVSPSESGTYLTIHKIS